MKWLILCSLFLVAFVAAQESEEVEELPLAEICDAEKCKLPDCLCSSVNIPGGLDRRDTPQFVTVTMDDGVNIINIETYRRILYGRFNNNGCPAGVTFYVNHEYTDYTLVNELYNNGFEIGLHSITHQTPQSYWAEATYETMVSEFADQKVQMSYFANIPSDEIKGIRVPFLQMSGNSSFIMMARHGFVYDSTWPTIQHTDPGMWPYTLEYESTQDCPTGPCPSASIPQVWVNPMLTWTDLGGIPCSMVDACFNFPDREDENAWFRFILTNFERQYMGNRAPFGFYIHEAYLQAYPAVERALVRFMDLINNMEDVFMVNGNEVIDWVKNPVPVDEYKRQPCRTFPRTFCPAASCSVVSEHNMNTYWMRVCNVCPRTYPWVGNPLGQ